MKKIFLLAFVLLMFGQVQAQTPQKVGHFNLNNFLVSLPEVADIDSTLRVYEGTFVDTMKQMQAKLEADFKALQKESNDLTAMEVQKRQEQLYIADDNLKKYPAYVEQMMYIKRQELLLPILEKLDVIVKEIGKTGKYAVILDASMMNALLFAQDADDITPMVKEKYDKL